METTCCVDGRDRIAAIMTRSARDDNGRSVGLGPASRGSANASRALPIPHASTNYGTPLARFFRRQFCVVAMERFQLADGTLRPVASRAT